MEYFKLQTQNPKNVAEVHEKLRIIEERKKTSPQKRCKAMKKPFAIAKERNF